MPRVELYTRMMQLNGLNKHLREAKEHHEEEIKTLSEAIAELEEQAEWHKKKKKSLHKEELEEKMYVSVGWKLILGQ